MPSRQHSQVQNQSGFGTGPGKFCAGTGVAGLTVIFVSVAPSANRSRSTEPEIPGTLPELVYCQIV